jgi:hypothetical protein
LRYLTHLAIELTTSVKAIFQGPMIQRGKLNRPQIGQFNYL